MICLHFLYDHSQLTVGGGANMQQEPYTRQGWGLHLDKIFCGMVALRKAVLASTSEKEHHCWLSAMVCGT